MERQKKAGISQCMIVKNEEKNIRQALSWGKGIVSEQIVVDTGSTDQTIEIARQMGAKVFSFSWIDDFAAAKNYAISLAEYEWIALLDADEFFSSEDASKLLSYIENISDDYDSIVTRWIHLDNKGQVLAADSQIRVFRNLESLRYQRRIHEYLTKTDGSQNRACDATAELSILHTGYGDQENQQKKGSQRNLRLIKAELTDHPDDWEMYGYLGNEYDLMEEYVLAEEAYQKAIARMPERLAEYDQRASDTFARLLQLLALEVRAEEAKILKTYEQARTRMPKEADFDYIMGKYYASRQNYQQGEEYLKQALVLLEQHGSTARSKMLAGNFMSAYELLAACCFNNGQLVECVKLTTAILKEDPYIMSTAVLLLSAFEKDAESMRRGKQGAEEILGFLGNSFYHFQELQDRLFVLRAAMAAGYEELLQVVRQMFTVEELAAIDQSFQQQSQENRRQRMVLFYSGVESFNFFTDQLAEELRARGHEIFILDLLNPPDGDPHSYENLNRFLSRKIDAVICFDGLGTREENEIKAWDSHDAVVVDILMDPPFRFHPTLEKHARNYLLFCCDLEHVEYVKKYFAKEVPWVAFMPHIGVLPDGSTQVIPYKDKKYDILFSGTYYRPESQLAEVRRLFPDDENMFRFYESVFECLVSDTELTIEQAVLGTMEQMKWSVPEDVRKTILNCAVHVDWAIRMFERERVVTVLAEAGFELYLLGRGWENHPSSGLSNVHRIDDRIPYGETLAYMADAKINLNVMPWFKAGTHDRIFNTLLQHSVPLTDPSVWITDNFTDGVDIALYDLKHLDELPGIVRRLLTDSDLAERIIQNGYEKVSRNLTFRNCVDWVLEAIIGVQKNK